MRESYATVWEAIADAIPDADALVQGERRVTWGAFDDRAARIASALASFGIGPDTPVALFLHNSPEFVEALTACLKIRAVATGVNARSGQSELAHVLGDARAGVLVYHRSLGEVVAATQPAMPTRRALVDVDDGSDAPRLAGALAYEDLVATHDPAPRIPRSGDDPLLWYTGGTTGTPKGVLWEQQALLTFELVYGAALLDGVAPTTPAEAARTAAALTIGDRRLVTLATTPLAHATGANQLHLTLAHGGTLVLLPLGRVDGDEICRTVERERVRLLSVVGDVVLRRVVDALDRASAAGMPYDLSSLWRVHSSGSTARAATKDALHAYAPQIDLYDSLGATEGVGFATMVTTRSGDTETGRFRLGANARVLSPDDRDVVAGSGDAGILAVTASTGFAYLRDPERSAAAFRDIGGARHAVLGDWAVPHADGTITLLGRGTQCINTGGEKVWPEEVEEVLVAHPAVRDAVVVGIPDDEWGEVVATIVATHPLAAPPDADELAEWVAARLARYKRPRRVAFAADVPRTPLGKPDRESARVLLTS